MLQSTRSQYEKLLVDLHREMRAGKSNSVPAENIRREMEAPWYALTEDEQEIFDDLSEDLYIIEGKRCNTPLDNEATFENIRKCAQTAFEDGKIRETLSLLRKLPTLDGAGIFAMAQCWRHLGFHYACVCFYDYADELEPTDLFQFSATTSMAARPTLHRRLESIRAKSQRTTPTTRVSKAVFPFPSMRSIEGLSR